ncbi:hypothetical protein ACQKL0_11925 [Peribacillus sp. NPDC097264]|uniref:hypothetical protein n=1 Tax=Peribacillus sp. NPDC097264 TaxID=3390616 RepID=UPI003CFC9490
MTEEANGGKGKLIIWDETEYQYRTDEEYDHLLEISDYKVKVTLKFAKSEARNEVARKGLKAFFRGIWF